MKLSRSLPVKSKMNCRFPWKNQTDCLAVHSAAYGCLTAALPARLTAKAAE